MASNPVTRFAEEQYLALGRAAEVRSEVFEGEMFAMPGGSMRHARLQGNICMLIRMSLWFAVNLFSPMTPGYSSQSAGHFRGALSLHGAL